MTKRFRMVLAVSVVLASALVPALKNVGAHGGERIYPLSGPPPNDRVLQWTEEALQCVRSRRRGATIAARGLFILSAATHIACAAYDVEAGPTVTAGFFRRRFSQWTVVINRQAVSRVAPLALSGVFSACRLELDRRLAVMGYPAGGPSAPALTGRIAGLKVMVG